MDFFGQGVKVVGHGLPRFQHPGSGTVHAEDVAQALFLKHQRDVVDVGHIVRAHHGLGLDVAERCEFVACFLVEW